MCLLLGVGYRNADNVRFGFGKLRLLGPEECEKRRQRRHTFRIIGLCTEHSRGKCGSFGFLLIISIL